MLKIMEKLMFYVDVDGVINSINHLYGHHSWDRWSDPTVNPVRTDAGYTIHLPDYMPGLMKALHEVGEWRWLTTWRHRANACISPLLGIPNDLPVIDDGTDDHYVGWKYSTAVPQAMEDVAAGYKVYWIEDFGSDDHLQPHSRPIWDYVTPINTDSDNEAVLLPQHLPANVQQLVEAAGYDGPSFLKNPSTVAGRFSSSTGSAHGANV
jgi:hypothetical protein